MRNEEVKPSTYGPLTNTFGSARTVRSQPEQPAESPARCTAPFSAMPAMQVTSADRVHVKLGPLASVDLADDAQVALTLPCGCRAIHDEPFATAYAAPLDDDTDGGTAAEQAHEVIPYVSHQHIAEQNRPLPPLYSLPQWSQCSGAASLHHASSPLTLFPSRSGKPGTTVVPVSAWPAILTSRPRPGPRRGAAATGTGVPPSTAPAGVTPTGHGWREPRSRHGTQGGRP